ncbi:MAG: IS1595 family transposase [bacterium]|nr:IS1595 family transposase [bacterium]
MSERRKAPGRNERNGITLFELFKMFPTDEAAEQWLIERRWPNRIACVSCGSVNVQTGAKHRTMPFRCREKGCAKKFSIRTGTVMEASNLGYQTWVFAIYIVTTSLKGVSSMKLHRDLGISQKSAWFVLHRLREAMRGEDFLMCGPVEADETYVGGLEKNKHKDKKMKAAGGPVGKAIVAGVKDRCSNRVSARVVPDTKAATLTRLVADHVEPGTEVFTDEARGYLPLSRMGFDHASVKHSVGQYVDGMAHTNGMESFWSLLKRGYHGTYHQMSYEHLHRYVAEFQHRHNERPKDTIDQMAGMVKQMDGRRLSYEQLIAQGPRAVKRLEEIAA